MSKRILQIIVTLAGVAGVAAAQATPTAPKTAVKTKGLSQAEAKAVRKVMDSKEPDERIAAVDALITGFPETTFKAWAYDAAAQAAASKPDEAKAEYYGKLAVQADPMRFDDMLLVAGEIAQHTRKNDLDRDAKLEEANKLVKQALDMLPMAAKPADVTSSDADWEKFKKDETATAHGDLGLIAAAQEKWDEAAKEFQMAADMSETPDQVLLVHLGDAYMRTKDYAKADEVLKKVQAMPNLNPTVKAVADQEENNAARMLKSGGK